MPGTRRGEDLWLPTSTRQRHTRRHPDTEQQPKGDSGWAGLGSAGGSHGWIKTPRPRTLPGLAAADKHQLSLNPGEAGAELPVRPALGPRPPPALPGPCRGSPRGGLPARRGGRQAPLPPPTPRVPAALTVLRDALHVGAACLDDAAEVPRRGRRPGPVGVQRAVRHGQAEAARLGRAQLPAPHRPLRTRGRR